ncbi:type II secretion system protein GspM [Methylopila sp. M107]|uniref:type II secretion system protein GspM n=1 Tax=Methylopila sp. M107 TaxID=1101190 RepID=UPI000364C279|nr:type II secretion system protein GspM [Methylopila sp. M107]
MSAAAPSNVRRVATGAFAVAIPLAAIAFSAVTLLQANETGALADQQARTVGALERRVERLGDRAAAARDAAAVYLKGDGAELARAELQTILVDVVAGADARLIETQEPGGAADRDAPDDGRVELRVTFDARNDALIDVLYALETRLPLLTIERLETRRLDSAGDENPADPTLRVGLVVRGHRKLPA